MNVVVVGQGYVGLPLAIAAVGAGHEVCGLELNERVVTELNGGRSHVGDVADAELAAAVATGRYRATTSPACVAEAEVVVICVPTPYHDEKPDLSYIEAAAQSIAPHLRPGATVILESTTYPGTTEEVLVPLLEQGSDRRAGVDLHVVFSPERIDPGNPTYGLHNTPKIVGAITDEGSERAAAFYGSFVERVVRVSGPKAAEMAKLLENTFRHINIALVNELAILSQDLDVDVWEVIDAAASKPFGFMPFYPGPGVGGHCIPVDPMYLSWRARQFGGSAKFIELARDVNDAMPLYCASRVQDLLNDRERALKGSVVLIVGVAYKADISDMRESPALPLIGHLRSKGAIVRYHDPHVPELRLDDGDVLRSMPLDAALDGAACAVIVTPHRAIDLDAVIAGVDVVFDTRNAVRRDAPNVHRL